MRPLVRQHGEFPRWKWARWLGRDLELVSFRSEEVRYELLCVYGKVAGVVDPAVVAPTPDEEFEQAVRDLEEVGIHLHPKQRELCGLETGELEGVRPEEP